MNRRGLLRRLVLAPFILGAGASLAPSVQAQDPFTPVLPKSSYIIDPVVLSIEMLVAGIREAGCFHPLTLRYLGQFESKPWLRFRITCLESHVWSGIGTGVIGHDLDIPYYMWLQSGRNSLPKPLGKSITIPAFDWEEKLWTKKV